MEDGHIEFLGRRDHQVKLRGYRIELGEIENALRDVFGVQDAVVLLRDLRGSGPELVAYLLGTGEKGFEDRARELLGGRLPQYMVPQIVARVDAWPLTANGKIDHNALPMPTELEGPEEEYMAPSTPLEHQLIDVWQQVLGVRRVGMHSDFFALGGHSLLAIRLVAKLREALGVEISLRTIYETRTVHGLLGKLDAHEALGCATSRRQEGLVDLNSHAGPHTLYCVHPAGGGLRCYLRLAVLLEPHIRMVGIPAQDQAENTDLSIAGMAAEYVDRVLRHQPQGPYLLCGWSLGGNLAFEMACQLRRLNKEVAFVGLIDSSTSTDGALDERFALSSFQRSLGLNDVANCGNSTRERLSAMLSTLRKQHSLYENVTEKELVSLFNTYYAHGSVLQQWLQEDAISLDCALDVFRCTGQPDSQCGTGSWKERTSLECSIHDVAGDHFSVLADPNVSEVADTMVSILEQRRLTATSARDNSLRVDQQSEMRGQKHGRMSAKRE